MSIHTIKFTGKVTRYELLQGSSDPFGGSIAVDVALSGSYTFESPAHDYQPDHGGQFFFTGGEYGINVSVGSNDFVFHDVNIHVESGLYGFNSIHEIRRGDGDKFVCEMEHVQVEHEETESTNPFRFNTVIPKNPPGLSPDTRYHTELTGTRIVDGNIQEFRIHFVLDSMVLQPQKPKSPSGLSVEVS